MDVYSDPALVSEIRKYGYFDVSGCFSCGSCTAICNLSDDSAAFPRKTMRVAQLGLRGPLASSLEPWLCYYCGQCSKTCPRKAEPGESMMTLRRYLVSVYDWTGLAAKINRSGLWHAGALIFIGILFLLLMVGYHLVYVKMGFTDFASTPMGLAHMFPLMDDFTFAVIVGPLLLLATNAVRMAWLLMRSGEHRASLSSCLAGFGKFLFHFSTQKRIVDCEAEKGRWLTHFLIGSSCTAMLVILVFFLKWFQTDELLPIYHPQRWVGYLITIAMIYGSASVLLSRTKKQQEIHRFSDFSDWSFPLLLLGTAVTGILIHICRYAGFQFAAHYTYIIHLLIAVPMLVIEIPFGKWAHMVYRPLALWFQSSKEAR